MNINHRNNKFSIHITMWILFVFVQTIFVNLYAFTMDTNFDNDPTGSFSFNYMNSTPEFIIGGGSYNVEAGSTFNTPIQVTNLPNTSAINFEVEYDPNLLTWEKIITTDTLLAPLQIVADPPVSGSSNRHLITASGTTHFYEWKWNTCLYYLFDQQRRA